MSRKIILRVAAASLAFFIYAVPISAQRRARARRTPTPAQPAPVRQDLPPQIERTPDASVESADISITATVRARELTFEVVPNPTVEFPGTHKRDTIWDAVRENLPPAVQPGVTYRDIGIRLKIVSRFADIDRIVAEALGEVPVTDQVQPPDDANPQQSTPTTPAPSAPTSQPNGGSPR